ncbi:MAG: CapA family protein [Clostridia bacterium]|nr:CapA family protein [Clostridia bacterium]
MSKQLTVTATGDALFVAKFPDYYDEQKNTLKEFINSHSLKITNLETNLSDFGHFANAYSGGTWINTPKEYFSHLSSLGFNFYGTANNHCMDYSHYGLTSTIDYLDSLNLAHAGTGKDLYDAEKPAILNLDGNKVAIFAIDTSFEPASMAGYPTKNFKGRPGVNYLRHSKTFTITKEEMQALKDLAKKTSINFDKELHVRTGYATADKDGTFNFGGISFTTNENEPITKCNKKDKQRLLSLIKNAKKECDYVFVLIHCHANDLVNHANPPAFLEEFCHECIDNGVSAIFGGGCHQLRKVEIYKNKPIFYSLGDFIYQGPQVEKLPADFMLKYDADINLSAKDALLVRSQNNKIGLHTDKANYLSFLPSLSFDGENLSSIKLLPIELNFDSENLLNGLPKIAKGKDALEIVQVLNDLNTTGEKFEMENGYIIIK